MATSSLNEDPVTWLESGQTIRDIVYKNKLPALVKVSEGYYSDNDAESFSCGDLLKLDFVKTIMKVSALVGEANVNVKGNKIDYLKWNDEILIPLGYKGKVQIVLTEGHQNVFHSVRELVKAYPRFIRTEHPVPVSGGNGPYTIPAGAELELDRILPDQGLVCRFEGKEGLIGFEVEGKFVLIEDNTCYTLQEIIDRLSLPQYVKFVETEFQKLMTDNLDEAIQNIQNFSGVLQLRELVTHQVIVGHHKPAVTTDESARFCERSIVLLPMDSPLVDEIEVLTPVCADTEEYEMVMARNFSQNVNMGMVDGGLYLELARNPKVHRLSHIGEEKPPPIPPRVKNKNHMDKVSRDGYIDMSRNVTKQEKLVKDSEEIGKDATILHDMNDYDYPDVSKIAVKEVKKAAKPGKSRTVKGRPLPLAPNENFRDNIPVGKVLPQNTNSKKNQNVMFSSLSVHELVGIFKDCNLTKLADICKKEKLDGAFFDALTESQLENKPFCLDKVQLMKVKEIKKGWRPKV